MVNIKSNADMQTAAGNFYTAEGQSFIIEDSFVAGLKLNKQDFAFTTVEDLIEFRDMINKVISNMLLK